MHREFVGEMQARPRRLDRIEVADHVGDRHVGGGELLHVAIVTREPADLECIPFLAHALAARGTERRQRIVVDLAAGHHGNLGVEQRRERAQDAALRLAAQTKQDEVVSARAPR